MVPSQEFQLASVACLDSTVAGVAPSVGAARWSSIRSKRGEAAREFLCASESDTIGARGL
eukprot:459971-Prymnesium_polylepis.1